MIITQSHDREVEGDRDRDRGGERRAEATLDRDRDRGSTDDAGVPLQGHVQDPDPDRDDRGPGGNPDQHRDQGPATASGRIEGNEVGPKLK